MALTSQMTDTIWSNPDYYEKSKIASESDHPSLNYLLNRYRGKKILEVGCGEGTKLSLLDASYRAGIDISPLAIARAKQKIDLAQVASAEKLPFADNSFDSVLSFFSIEHFENPEKVLHEMMRVVKRGGEIAILTPNFGAPNRCSPCYRGNRLFKLVVGFIKDFIPSKKLNWHHVTPLTQNQDYQIDYDTLVEPYIKTLANYLERFAFQLVKVDSNWEINQEHENMLQKLFKWLGKAGIFPFNYWGPHCFIVARRK